MKDNSLLHFYLLITNLITSSCYGFLTPKNVINTGIARVKPTTTPYSNSKNVISRYSRISSTLRIPSIVIVKSNNISNDQETTTTGAVVDPQVISTGYSQSPDLITALEEATTLALSTLPTTTDSIPIKKIDLAMVFVSSLYDGQVSPSKVIPTILDVCNKQLNNSSNDNNDKTQIVQKIIGCYSGAQVGSKCNMNAGKVVSTGSDDNKNNNFGQECFPSETENASVVVTLCLLPDTEIKTFHVEADDVPDDLSRITPEQWKNAVGLRKFNSNDNNNNNDDDEKVFMLLPAPSFQKDLDDFLRGFSMAFGSSATIFGGVASTVSSLSRARLFRYDVDDNDLFSEQTMGDGCVGVAISGDITAKVMVAQGAKPVGGIYRIVSGQESTIGTIQLDEVATQQLADSVDDDGDEIKNDNDDDEDDDDLKEEQLDAKKQAAAAYAKAVIPKPVLAEANYLMKTLSDDDQSFMRKSLLVGLERSGGMAKTPDELLRLAEGEGHRFTVHQVASAGMKDGSVTLPLGRVNIERGTRLRFFVRDGQFAKKEVNALWMGYKKKLLQKNIMGEDSESKSKLFSPSGCIVLPTLDRGVKLFGGKSGFESSTISEFLPSIPSIFGFFNNGVIAKLDESDSHVMIHGSASCVALIGSKTNRPIYSAGRAYAKQEEEKRLAEEKVKNEKAAALEDEKRNLRMKVINSSSNDDDDSIPAPRSEDGELILRRREIHSGRALTVSTVEWSVVEKTAKPSSALEGFMWDKETEVDRLRERVPLANLVSQCKLSLADPSFPKPRDWVGPIKLAIEKSGFVIIPEMKRMEPSTGSLRKRYDIAKLSKQFSVSGAPALSVNCDAVLFGGSLEDIKTVRETSTKAMLDSASAEDGVIVPPIVASDLLLYPYQLYKLRLAGADAATLLVGALASKDMLYLTKIAASLQMQMIASVTSEVQIKSISKLSKGSIQALVLSNRNLESFSFDQSGLQALNLLKSEALKEFKSMHEGIPILVEGRVGLIEMNGSTEGYIEALKEAGAVGAIIGGGLASETGNTLIQYASN